VLLECSTVSDWRQIQARIRKAKTSSEPAAQLAKLFERTRDAMAAFELAAVEERAGNSAEAIRWYTTAAQRFRRADWKTKAHDGLTRLGAAIPETPSPDPAQALPQEAAEQVTSSSTFTFVARVETSDATEAEPAASPDEFFRRVLDEERPAPSTQPPAALESGVPAVEGAAGRRRRHRGRRGGRGRRKGKGPAASTPAAGPTTNKALTIDIPPVAPAARSSAAGDSVYTARAWEPAAAPPPSFTPRSSSAEVPDLERGPQMPVRGRPGDPALSSRQAYLESQLRRLLAAAPRSVGEADLAPAGPGVFLISDSDQITYYYVEACQTLRIGIANVLRERRGRVVEREPLRGRFAENLGIPEARVSKYLKDNCLVRWLQLDDGASNLAHFAIAVLRPALND
jgi:hypothetical protein